MAVNRQLYSRYNISMDGMRQDHVSGIKRDKVVICSLGGVDSKDLESVMCGVQLMIKHAISRKPLDVSTGQHPSFGSQFSVIRVSAQLKDQVNVHRVFVGHGKMTFLEGDTSVIFGASLYPNVFLSLDVPEFEGIARNRILTLLSAHEVGHLLSGLVNRNFNIDDTSHCGGEVGPCVMRNGLRNFIQIQGDDLLCSDCQTHVEKNRDYLDDDGLGL